MNSLLLIEDDDDVAAALERTLRREGYAPVLARDLREGRAALQRAVFDVVLLDLGLPDGDGLGGIDAVLAVEPHARVVVVTGRNDVTLAVHALQRGAVDYVVKPWERDALLRAIERAFGEGRLRREIEAARVQLDRGTPRAVGASPAWKRSLDELLAAAESPRAPVLITGESGTGKDVAAALVHQHSPRAQGPFVTLNAACLPASMIESELFGHEPGAFTGARAARRGLFELASGGTLFLDEVGELPLDLQPKLLRVLEGHAFRRLGGEREVRTDVRLVAATNRSLPAMIAQGRFREDLYYRLRVLEVTLPPLRERPGDARELALHFLTRMAREAWRPGATIEPAALACLERYAWPGNVRELRNVVERALVLARGDAVGVAHLPEGLRHDPAPPEPCAPRAEGLVPQSADAASPAPSAASVVAAPSIEAASDETLEGALRRHVLAVYARHQRNLSRTAAALGITRVALRRKLRECGAYEAPPAPLASRLALK